MALAFGTRSAGRNSDHRDRPARLLLIAGVAIAVVVVDDPPQPVVVGIAAFDDAGASRPALPTDLYLHLGVSAQVVEPGRRLVGATCGGDDEVIVAVARVDEGIRAGHSGASARRTQEEGGHADHGMTDPPVASHIDLLMEAKDRPGQSLADCHAPKLMPAALQPAAPARGCWHPVWGRRRSPPATPIRPMRCMSDRAARARVGAPHAW